MHPEAVTAQMEAYYEDCETTGWAFVELFRLCIKLTVLSPPAAFLFTAQNFPLEYQFYTHRLAGSARLRLPHAGRFEIDFRPEWN